MRRAFTVPGFGRLYIGTAASMVGDSLMLIVMSMWAKTLTGSNGAAGLTFLFLTLPALAGPLFGIVVDRVPRRPFLVVANVLSAFAMLPLLLVNGEEDLWLIYAVAFLYGISFVVVPAALNGLLKEMLTEDVLVEANASLSLTREALRLVGPVAGAAMFALGSGKMVAVIDALSFLVAAVVIWTIRLPEERPERVPMHWAAEVAEGARHIRRTPLLLHPTVALAMCLLVLGFSESALYAVVEAFDKPVEFVGPVLTVQGVGAIAAGVLVSRVIRRVGEPRTLVAGLLVLATGLAGIAAAQQVWQLLAGTVVLGAGIPLLIVAFNTILQKQTPGHLMGRVSTTTEVLTTTPQALSIALGALLVSVWDWRVIFSLMVAGTLAGAGYLVVALRGRMVLPVAREAGPVDVPLIPGTVLPETLVEPAP
ncbi:MAG: MFS transporter [Nocardioides sp.]